MFGLNFDRLKTMYPLKAVYRVKHHLKRFFKNVVLQSSKGSAAEITYSQPVARALGGPPACAQRLLRALMHRRAGALPVTARRPQWAAM